MYLWPWLYAFWVWKNKRQRQKEAGRRLHFDLPSLLSLINISCGVYEVLRSSQNQIISHITLLPILMLSFPLRKLSSKAVPLTSSGFLLSHLSAKRNALEMYPFIYLYKLAWWMLQVYSEWQAFTMVKWQDVHWPIRNCFSVQYGWSVWFNLVFFIKMESSSHGIIFRWNLSLEQQSSCGFMQFLFFSCLTRWQYNFFTLYWKPQLFSGIIIDERLYLELLSLANLCLMTTLIKQRYAEAPYKFSL